MLGSSEQRLDVITAQVAPLGSSPGLNAFCKHGAARTGPRHCQLSVGGRSAEWDMEERKKKDR